jgi:lipopolysaccharide transport system permease protein
MFVKLAPFPQIPNQAKAFLMPLLQYFRLVDLQARMLLKADASRFALGYLWWFLEPLVWVGVFYVVFNLILESRRGVDFLLFLACGKFAFIWFSKTVAQASNSIVANQSLLSKIDVPKTLFPMGVVQESLYRQAAVYLLLFVILWSCGYSANGTWLWLLPVLLVNYLIIVACSLVGAYLVCLLRDFSKVIPLGMTFLLFTSGIFWDVRGLGDPAKTDLILNLNPIAFMLDAHRQILMYQTAPDLVHLLQIGLGAGVLVGLMVFLIGRNSQYLALKVLT